MFVNEIKEIVIKIVKEYFYTIVHLIQGQSVTQDRAGLNEVVVKVYKKGVRIMKICRTYNG